MLRLSSILDLLLCSQYIALSSFSHHLARVNFRVHISCFGLDFGIMAAFERTLELAPIQRPLWSPSSVLHMIQEKGLFELKKHKGF